MGTVVGFVDLDSGVYSWSSPDFPGVAAASPSYADLVVAARTAVVARIEELRASGAEIPTPRSWPQIRADPACAEDLSASLSVLTVDLPEDT